MMTSETMAERMVQSARILLRERPGSAAFRRRAISAAYYAVFHALAKQCADHVMRTTRRSSDEYERVYRALEHGPLKRAFTQGPLKDVTALRQIGLSAARLQEARHEADYLPPNPGRPTLEAARELVDLAAETVRQVEELADDSGTCRTLAVALLFRDGRR